MSTLPEPVKGESAELNKAAEEFASDSFHQAVKK